MLRMFRASRSSVLIWALMGLLVIGLAGFGIGTAGLGSRNVASVGGEDVTAEEYARAVEQELRAISAQIGRNLTMAEARQFGVDRMVLARLVNDAALDAEAERLGLRASDAMVRDQIEATPAFRGAAGGFDPETYRFALQRAGLAPAGFEAQLRNEATRALVATAVQSATALPDTAALSVLGYLGERRGFDWLRLDATALERPMAPPADSVVADYYAKNPERYTRPETRRITYARLSPETLAEGIEVPEAELRAAYDAAPERFGTPERRIVDRIGFGTMEEAAAARARLDAGEVDFDALAAERGLSAEEIDQGALAATDLAPEPREAVFGAEGPGIIGSVATPLGPSLYRVNAITAAQVTPFEEARTELARERALEEARSRIAAETGPIEDLLAGGATLEEIAAETEMELGTIELNAESEGDLAVDPAFRRLADEAREGEASDPATLADGSLVSLRVDAVEPPALIPLEGIRDRVAADWTAAETQRRLVEQAEALRAEVAAGETLSAVASRRDLAVRGAGPLTRGETLPGLPPEIVADVFAAEAGGVVVRPDGDGVIVAQVSQVEPFDAEAAENAQAVEAVRTELRDQAAEDVLALYTAALRDAAGVSLDTGLVESTLAQFP